MQQRNQFQLTSSHQIPLTNTFHMPTKCIYVHTHEEFTMQTHIQAYKGNTNVYGPLWTLTHICTIWTYFSYYSLCSFSLIFPKRHYHSPYHRQSHDRLFPSPQHHVCLHPPIFSCLLHILLLFLRTISPYFTCINQVDTTPYLTSIWVLYSLSQPLSKSWHQLHCSHQALWLLLPVTSWSYH